jgi:hypothetical protein
LRGVTTSTERGTVMGEERGHMLDKRPEQILSNTNLYIDAAVRKWQQDLKMRAMFFLMQCFAAYFRI